MPGGRLDQKREDFDRSVDDLLRAATPAASPATLEEAQQRLVDTSEQLHVAEEELHQQNEELLAQRLAIDAERRRYHDLFQLAPDAYLVTDFAALIEEANHAAADLLAVPAGQLARKPLASYVPLPSRPRFRSLVEQVRRQRETSAWEFELQRRDGRLVYVAATVGPAARADGEVVGLRWILHDVTRRVAAEHEVRKLADELEERVRQRTAELERANAAKDEFLGLVSHELRTPLTTMVGNAEVLRRRAGELRPEQSMQALVDMEREGRRLKAIVENLLVLARLQSGTDIGREPLVLERVIADAVTKALRDHPEARIEVRIHRRLPPVVGATIQVDQILENLLSNALKYGPAGASVVVEAATRDGVVRVSVLDSGPGVPAEEQGQMFEPFYRSSRTAAGVSGAGLGLAVCRRLAEALGGTIGAENVEGAGLMVWLELPVAGEEG